jgi:hypothetical protein
MDDSTELTHFVKPKIIDLPMWIEMFQSYQEIHRLHYCWVCSGNKVVTINSIQPTQINIL